jgi:hypothetical protein
MTTIQARLHQRPLMTMMKPMRQQLLSKKTTTKKNVLEVASWWE